MDGSCIPCYSLGCCDIALVAASPLTVPPPLCCLKTHSVSYKDSCHTNLDPSGISSMLLYQDPYLKHICKYIFFPNKITIQLTRMTDNRDRGGKIFKIMKDQGEKSSPTGIALAWITG